MALKTVVFGGAGFLGSHLSDALSDSGHQVTVFDRQQSHYLRSSQKMVVGDILDGETVMAATEGADVVYNLAGIADLDDATIKPVETVRQNVLGNAILLESARNHGVKRYVYASTVYVYSQLGGFYRCSKQAAELYVEEYQRKWGLDYTIVRYGTLYGSRADSRNSIYRYIRQALTDGLIRCQATGEEVREYINVIDAARLSVELLENEYRNQHMIITGQNPMRFREMLDMIREMLGNRVEVEYLPANADHYKITPYAFAPKVGRKLIGKTYHDMGQGLLQCLHELFEEVGRQP